MKSKKGRKKDTMRKIVCFLKETSVFIHPKLTV